MPDAYSARLELTDDKRKVLGQEILTKIEASRTGMRELLNKMKEWDEFYLSNLPKKNFPWPDCANFNVPLIPWIVDTMNAYINDTVFGVEPVTMIEPPPSKDDPDLGFKKYATKVESAYSEWSEYMRLDRTMHSTFNYALRHPTAIVKFCWREENRITRRRVASLDGYGEPTETVEEKKTPKYRGARAEFVDLRNFVIYPLTTESIENAELVGDTYRLSPTQVQAKINGGFFTKEWAQELVDHPGNEESDVEVTDHSDIEDYQGIEKVPYDQQRFWEVIYGYDYDGDGEAEDCVFTLEALTGKIVRAIKFPYDHGRRHYIDFGAYTMAGRFFGRGLCQMLESCQKELNAVHNQRSDAVTLALCKIFRLDPTSGLNADTIRVFPGAVFKAAPSELEEIEIDVRVPGLDVEQITRDYAERLSGVNDIAVGKTAEGSKTLGEIEMTSSAGGVRMGDVVKRFQMGMCEIARQTVRLYGQFATDEELAGWGLVNDQGAPLRELLLVDWNYVPHGNQGTADKARQKQSALEMYQLLMQNPLVTADAKRIHRVAEDLLLAYDRKSVDSYIGTSQEAEAWMQQQQEAQAKQQEQLMQMQAQQLQADQQNKQSQMMMQAMQLKHQEVQQADSLAESEAERQSKERIAAKSATDKAKQAKKTGGTSGKKR